jgi:hypothetical protein
MNKRSIGKAQPRLTRDGGGRWFVATAGPGLVLEHTMSDVVRNHIRYRMICLYRMQITMS